MTAIIPTIRLFTSKDDTGIHINSLILEHNGNNCYLQGGTKNTIHVFIESTITPTALKMRRKTPNKALQC